MKEKLWAGRFEEKTNKEVEAFTSSLKDDYRLFQADIFASKVHLKELRKANLVTKSEEKKISDCLDELLQQYKQGSFILKPEYEDVHMNIEFYLIEKLGETGKKIHAGRSRNDQVVTALKLTLLKRVERVIQLLLDLEETLVLCAEENQGIIIPGYTHLQKAQPILLPHYYMCYFEMFYRDIEKILFFKHYLLESPLGAGALAGNPFHLDRESMARELGFSKPTNNSLDSVADRDYVLDMLYGLSLIMLHFSRLSEDMIIWSSDEFGYITISDAYTTGSSIMPQKKNPDVSELTRGRTGRVLGDLLNLFTTMKGLPMAYNRDLQEDKHAIFDALNTVEQVLRVNVGLLQNIKINKENIEKHLNKGFLLATDLADYLVHKGMAFREAHQLVGKIVKDLIKYNKTITDLTLTEFQNYSEYFKKDIMLYLYYETSIDSRDSYGGTANKCVKEQIKQSKKRIKEVKDAEQY
ncbi:MAG: argininosuccinate lyase [Candidatus Margulisbacteria bacterium]|nr:argininosuccinate lyase [Candidatus Margulisiibacteriota bacterium]